MQGVWVMGVLFQLLCCLSSCVYTAVLVQVVDGCTQACTFVLLPTCMECARAAHSFILHHVIGVDTWCQYCHDTQGRGDCTPPLC